MATNYPTSNLSGENVLRDIHDQEYQRIRVDAEVTAIVEDITVNVDLDYSTSSIAIGDPSSSNILTINGDGSINANVNTNHADDSMRLGDGTTLFTGSTVGPKIGLDVSLINATLPLPTGAATSSNQDTTNTHLSNIEAALSAPLDIDTDGFSLTTPDSMQTTGSIDGTSTGQKYGFVNNVRLQILGSHDRQAVFTYADFGTKNERITQIDYTSPTFPGDTLVRQFSYTLVSGKYRRDDETWTVI